MRKTRKANDGQDATRVLEKDHATVRRLLRQLESAKAPARRATLFARIREELVVHSRVEEEIFYPAFHAEAKRHDDDRMFFEAAEEHHLVDIVLAELSRSDPATDPFAAKAKVLKDLVEHHAEEEEDEMFPRARKLLSAERRSDIGRRIKERKKKLLSDGMGGAEGRVSAA